MNVKNAFIASAVASMFLSGAAMAKGKAHKKTAEVVKCAGINECKGKGWEEAKSEKACTDKGGKVLASNSKM